MYFYYVILSFNSYNIAKIIIYKGFGILVFSPMSNLIYYYIFIITVNPASIPPQKL